VPRIGKPHDGPGGMRSGIARIPPAPGAHTTHPLAQWHVSLRGQGTFRLEISRDGRRGCHPPTVPAAWVRLRAPRLGGEDHDAALAFFPLGFAAKSCLGDRVVDDLPLKRVHRLELHRFA
jgi:hypothetical protein